jgi:hypothetical protein
LLQRTSHGVQVLPRRAQPNPWCVRFRTAPSCAADMPRPAQPLSWCSSRLWSHEPAAALLFMCRLAGAACLTHTSLNASPAICPTSSLSSLSNLLLHCPLLVHCSPATAPVAAASRSWYHPAAVCHTHLGAQSTAQWPQGLAICTNLTACCWVPGLQAYVAGRPPAAACVAAACVLPSTLHRLREGPRPRLPAAAFSAYAAQVRFCCCTVMLHGGWGPVGFCSAWVAAPAGDNS